MEKLIEFPKRKLLGSFSIRNDGNFSENVTFKMNSRFFQTLSRLKCLMEANFSEVEFLWTALKSGTEVKKEKQKFVVLC